MSSYENKGFPVLDSRQLTRIEAVHRGFLYQHLYATNCLLLAGGAGIERVTVERDEDIELETSGGRVYLQVKTRQGNLNPGDISDALKRFGKIRTEHTEGKRPGTAHFAIISNAMPGPKLLQEIAADAWSSDVDILWPDGSDGAHPGIAHPTNDVIAMAAACAEEAGKLPFTTLRPDTLTWKLAGAVTCAASGTVPFENHAFTSSELPGLFEQFVIQMQELPAPPMAYRAQANEPDMVSEERVRIIEGLSGAGKTAWAAEAALHTPITISYLDVVNTPAPALAAALAREVAARLYGKGSALGEILLPGSSGLDTLGALGVKLGQDGIRVAIVLDNAHRLPAEELRTVIDRAVHLNFILLCQPGEQLRDLENVLGVRAEKLDGWDEDTIASVLKVNGCQADYATCERLSRLTGALPLFVENAAAIARREYDGSVAELCDDLEAQTNAVETRAEVLLRRAFSSLTAEQRETVAVLGSAYISLSADDAAQLLQQICNLSPSAAAKRLRKLPQTGFVETFGNAAIKIHDAARPVVSDYIDGREPEFGQKTLRSLRDVMLASLQSDWSIAKLAFMIELFSRLGETKVLVQFATDELFHEMGVFPLVKAHLTELIEDETVDAEGRFWALDGLVFDDLRAGTGPIVVQRLKQMEQLLEDHGLGAEEWLAWAMKSMIVNSIEGDLEKATSKFDEIEARLPDDPAHRRVFRYNRALAYFKMKTHEHAVAELRPLIDEYYEMLGISLEDIFGRNAPELRPLLTKSKSLTDDLKHLADCLDLLAMASDSCGDLAPFARIHALKFYDLAQAPESMIRVGQDLADEFVKRNDFIGARQVIETNLMRLVQAYGLTNRVVPLRGQYAVILAYCGEQKAAEDEMARLAPYETGLGDEQGNELRHQRLLVAQIGQHGPPPQANVTIPPAVQAFIDQRRGRVAKPQKQTKIGRNERCPCGSNRKYKHCHGR